jgi:hypothetical protein
MYTKEFITTVLEQLHAQEKAIFELTLVSNALVSALCEALPQVDYAKYYTQAMTSPQANEVLQRIRKNSERLDQLRRVMGQAE